MQTKDKRTSFSHTEEVGRQLGNAAAAHGMSVSTYVGEAVAEKLERDRRMAAWRELVGYDLEAAPAETLARVRAMFDRIEQSHR
ncbi:hypothetical protein ACTWPT_13220 [Nonomuraea sp. 3N208]|jgi:hypothetical protein|uniref:hypothetical protein n=1 Tax=Nonomuraea sp. 3N208 TaxID=3457421 RepID=UPI003FCDD1B9